MEKPNRSEIEDRLKKAILNNPNDVTYASWSGYIAAMLEWGLLSPEDHSYLLKNIPETSKITRALLGIFMGEESAEKKLKNASKSV